MQRFLLVSWLLVVLPAPLVAGTGRNYMSGMVGLGVAATQPGKLKDLAFQKQGTFRLMFDLNLRRRWLWGLDIDWQRIEPGRELSRTLDGEGYSFVTAYRHQRLTMWVKAGGGRWRSEAVLERGLDGASYPYYQVAGGTNYAFSTTAWVWVEGGLSLAWQTSEKALVPLDLPQDVMQVSLFVSIKLFNL